MGAMLIKNTLATRPHLDSFKYSNYYICTGACVEQWSGNGLAIVRIGVTVEQKFKPVSIQISSEIVRILVSGKLVPRPRPRALPALVPFALFICRAYIRNHTYFHIFKPISEIIRIFEPKSHVYSH